MPLTRERWAVAVQPSGVVAAVKGGKNSIGYADASQAGDLGTVHHLALEAERGVRDPQHVLDGGDVDGDVRGHLRTETSFRILDLEDHRVGDDVLRHLRVEADLVHLALEGFAGEGVGREADGLAGADPATSLQKYGDAASRSSVACR